MATRDELYAKFGITAEAAQLFETELGTLVLSLRGLENGWHVVPDGNMAKVMLTEVDRSTLGRLLCVLRERRALDDDLESRFSSALGARNRLIHGFYERHNFKIQTDVGRDEMIVDLEKLHGELFQAWQLASLLTSISTEIMLEGREKVTPRSD